MLLQNIPNPDYMNGTASMNSRFGLNSAESKDCGCGDHYDCGCGGNFKMSVQDCGCGGHGGLDCGCGGYYTMVGTHQGMGHGYGYDHDCGCDDHYDCGCGGHHKTMLGRPPAASMDCSCGAMGGPNCSCSSGMGTTGSLGVNLAAPLTRGGFPGEIFDNDPMPTGNWKDAPTPVMLGTAEEDSQYAFLYWQQQNPNGSIFDYAQQTWFDSNPTASVQKVAAFEAEYSAWVSNNQNAKLPDVLHFVALLTDALDNTYGFEGGTSAYVAPTNLVNAPVDSVSAESAGSNSAGNYAQSATPKGSGKALLLGAVGIGLIGFFDLY